MVVTCAVCRFFTPEYEWKDMGDCRRHAPIVPLRISLARSHNTEDERQWPSVYKMDSCGDFEPKETV